LRRRRTVSSDGGRSAKQGVDVHTGVCEGWRVFVGLLSGEATSPMNFTNQKNEAGKQCFFDDWRAAGVAADF
jgi:hypothetical protein